MGRKVKTPFKHELGNIAEACGLNESEIDKKYEGFVEEIKSNDNLKATSALIEGLEDNFNKRELSYIAGMKILGEAAQRSPLDVLLEKMTSR